MTARLTRRSFPVLLGLLATLSVLVVREVSQDAPRAQAQTPTFWQVFSPLSNYAGGGRRYVTSPSQYHNGASCPTSNYDDPLFDSPPTCVSGVGDGDWSMDIAASAGETVYIDMQSADGTTDFLVTAGSTGNFSANCWTQNYQYFNVYYLVGGNWTWVGYILLGHINSWYTTWGTQIIYSSGGRSVAAVGTVGSGAGQNPCPHVHVEMMNYSRWSIAHDWDGPYNTSDYALDPACVQSGIEYSPNSCNVLLDTNWVIGHLGGAATSFFEMPNPYYSASPDF